jgi:hypothetical protein
VKGWLILIAAVMGFIGLAIAAAVVWGPFAPSVVVLRNIGVQPAQLVLTDADHSTRVWSGTLGPGGRKTVIVWFKHEGSPELRCRDQISSNATGLEYVSGYMQTNANITIAGCEHIDPMLK